MSYKATLVLFISLATVLLGCVRILKNTEYEDIPTITAVQVETDPNVKIDVVVIEEPIVDLAANQTTISLKISEYKICRETRTQMIRRIERIEKTFDPPNSSMALGYLLSGAAVLGGGVWAAMGASGSFETGEDNDSALLSGSLLAAGGTVFGGWCVAQDIYAKDEKNDLGEVAGESQTEEKICEETPANNIQVATQNDSNEITSHGVTSGGYIKISVPASHLAKLNLLVNGKIPDKMSGTEHIDKALAAYNSHIQKMKKEEKIAELISSAEGYFASKRYDDALIDIGSCLQISDSDICKSLQSRVKMARAEQFQIEAQAEFTKKNYNQAKGLLLSCLNDNPDHQKCLQLSVKTDEILEKNKPPVEIVIDQYEFKYENYLNGHVVNVNVIYKINKTREGDRVDSKARCWSDGSVFVDESGIYLNEQQAGDSVRQPLYFFAYNLLESKPTQCEMSFTLENVLKSLKIPLVTFCLSPKKSQIGSCP